MFTQTIPSDRNDGAARGEAEFTQTIPSRDRGRQSQPKEQREERQSLLRLSRVVTEEDKVKPKSTSLNHPSHPLIRIHAPRLAARQLCHQSMEDIQDDVGYGQTILIYMIICVFIILQFMCAIWLLSASLQRNISKRTGQICITIPPQGSARVSSISWMVRGLSLCIGQMQ